MFAFDASILAPVFELQRPWLLIALLAAVLPWVLARRAERRGRGVSLISRTLQTFALAALAIALAGPAGLAESGDQPVLLLQDASASVRAQPTVSLPVEVPLRTVRFARGLAVDSDAELPVDATHLAAALRWAESVSPAPRAVLIRTDGRFQDDVATAAEALRRRGLPVAILPMSAAPPDARIAAFGATRRADGNVALACTVASNASLHRTLEIRQTLPVERRLARRPLSLRAGDRATARLTVSLSDGQGGSFVASLTPADTLHENDSISTAVLPREHRVGLIAPDAVGRWIAADVDRVDLLTPADMAAADSLLPYSAIVVVDPSGESLPGTVREALGRYVRAGGGLVVVGSGPRRSPADANDPLARALPMSFHPWRRSRLDVRLLLDASGSMGQTSEDALRRSRRTFDQAIEAALATGRHLTPSDRLSVWTFADTPRRRYTSGDGPPDFVALREALQAVKPAGATDAGKALAAAVKPPVAADANGLVLLLTDLQTRPLEVDALAGAFDRGGHQLAIVATGEAPDAHPGALQLRQLARRTGASLVRRDTPAGLAEVFARFVKGSRADALQTGEFTPVASGAAFGLPAQGWPKLGAYLRGRPREGAQVLLRTRREGDAVVARWGVGAGKVVSVALAGDRLAEHERWKRLTAAAVRWSRRPTVDPRFSADLSREDDTIALAVRAVDAAGRPINDLSLRAQLVSLAEASVDGRAELLQSAPGAYHGKLPAPAGPAYLSVTNGDGRVVYRRVVGGAIAPEFTALGAGRAALAELATRVGGRVIVREAQLAAFLQRARSRGRVDLTWLAMLLAAAMMLADWAMSRVIRRDG